MSVPGMEDFILLKRRVEELINDFKKAQDELEKAGSEKKELLLKLEEKEGELNKLNSEYERVKLSGAILGGGDDPQEARKRINILVREIDNCIALLNTI